MTTASTTTTSRLLQVANATLNATVNLNTTTSSDEIVTAAVTTSTSVTKVNYFAPSMECWAGAYYIHAVFAIILSIGFIIICIIVEMTYFETKSSTHNHSAKSNSKSDVFMLISKIIIILIFGFFGNSANQWILICVLFFLSAFIFFSYYEEMPFYDMKMMKVKLIFYFLFPKFIK